jgi:hypothetical protein
MVDKLAGIAEAIIEEATVATATSALRSSATSL